MGNVKWDVRNGAEYWKQEMGSEDCECSHHTSHMASEKWEVGLKRGFPFLKYPTLVKSPYCHFILSIFFRAPRKKPVKRLCHAATTMKRVFLCRKKWQNPRE